MTNLSKVGLCFVRIIDDVVYLEWGTDEEKKSKSQHNLAKDVTGGSKEDVEIMNFYRWVVKKNYILSSA